MNDLFFKLNSNAHSLYGNVRSNFCDSIFSSYTNKPISTLGFDFLTIGLIVSLVDRKILRDDSNDGWSRKLDVEIPVLNLENWNKSKRFLEKALSFVSGDYWTISFIKRDLLDRENKYLKSWQNKKHKKIEDDSIEHICMFSGGLDSFIGATDLLSFNTTNTIFINIRGGGNSYKHNFDSARDVLCSEYQITNKEKYFKSFLVKPWTALENTTRSRSFTFFTHALAYSTCFNNHIDLIIPENGTISLNVPLNYGRYGSCSTRTTHPYYIGLIQKIVNCLGMDVYFKNPYQFKTKGEMLSECKNFDFVKKNVNCTMSCSHPNSGRYQGNGKPGHCGTCLPCFIREAAELKAYGELITEYREPFSNATLSTLRCLKLRIKTFNEKNVLTEIEKNGQLTKNLSEYSDLYIRSIKELKQLLNFKKEAKGE